MNSIGKIFNAERRRTLLNYLRPSAYNSHPELKLGDIPRQKWKVLLTMRDLRLWVQQYAPFSSRHHKQMIELYQINLELNYLQTRGK